MSVPHLTEGRNNAKIYFSWINYFYFEAWGAIQDPFCAPTWWSWSHIRFMLCCVSCSVSAWLICSFKSSLKTMTHLPSHLDNLTKKKMICIQLFQSVFMETFSVRTKLNKHWIIQWHLPMLGLCISRCFWVRKTWPRRWEKSILTMWLYY